MKNPHIDCQDCESRKSSLFDQLCSDELSKLSLKKTCNIYKKGQVIFYEGNQPAGLYCVNQGKIKVYKMGKSGKEQIVRMAKPGDLLGYRSLIGEEVYTASAEALEDSRICFIDKNDFLHVLKNNQDLPTRVMQKLCLELKEAENYLQSLSQKSVRERLAETLLILKKKYGTLQDNPDILGITLTREDLANYVGTATETVIRLLSDMKEEGVIQFEGRKLKILAEDKLLEIADLDY